MGGRSKLRKAIGAVKDQTSIGLAKVGGSNASLADLDVAVVKATRHEEYPPDERHVQEILNLTANSRIFIGSCVRTIARRLNKTGNWVVALKTIMLVHRLLSEGDPSFEQEIFFATRRGTRLLNMSEFRDTSGKSSTWDYSAFVRTYALYLDEQLEFRMQSRRDNKQSSAGLQEMSIHCLSAKLHRLLQLLDRFLACKPTGAVGDNRVVIVALYPLVRESFLLYYQISEILNVLMMEKFAELEVKSMVRVQEIFSRANKQFDELETFYYWSKVSGVCRPSEYPDIEKISQEKLEMMDENIRDSRKPEEDMSAVKALPPSEQDDNKDQEEEEEKKKKIEAPNKEEPKKAQEAGDDLLNLNPHPLTIEEHANTLALLALFNGAPSTSPWETINNSSDNWETTLVTSSTHLPNQKTSFERGFNSTLTLDGILYQQGRAVAQTGSESSVTLGRASMVALSAPPTSSEASTIFTDP